MPSSSAVVAGLEEFQAVGEDPIGQAIGLIDAA
jgi:hypothetical protein